MTTEQFANNATSTLNGTISSSVTTLIVTSAALFPSVPQFRIIIDSEIMLVTGVSGTTFTVARGVENTTQASHNNGATVAMILTAGALSQFNNDNINSSVQTGTYASRPAFGTAGKLYLPNNSVNIYEDTGTSWQAFGPIFPITPPPIASNWVLRQTASNGTLTDTNGSLFLTATNRVSTHDYVIADMAAIATPYTVTMAFFPQMIAATGFPAAQLIAYETSSGKLVGFGPYADTTTGTRMERAFYATFVSAGTSSIDRIAFGLANLIWLRIKDDGTTRSYFMSSDGQNWSLYTSETRATGFNTAPDRYGFGVSAQNSPAGMNVVHWSVTTP
jgi:hypothetical protein